LIYSLRGILVKLQSTSEFEERYGEAVTVSPSGKYFLFKSGRERFEYTLARFSFDGFQRIKSLNFIQVLESILLRRSPSLTSLIKRPENQPVVLKTQYKSAPEAASGSSTNKVMPDNFMIQEVHEEEVKESKEGEIKQNSQDFKLVEENLS
jgi:hypothetical protein